MTWPSSSTGFAARKSAAHACHALDFHSGDAGDGSDDVVGKGYAAILFFPRVHIAGAQVTVTSLPQKDRLSGDYF
jgi:hypothetical protein